MYAKEERNRGFLAYALEFQRAADATSSPLVKAYLVGHALELLLKAYLLQHGYGESDLKSRRLGHRLDRLLTECKQHGLEARVALSADLVADIEAFSKSYAGKLLEYFSIIFLLAAPTVPDLGRVEEFTRQLSSILTEELRPA